MARTIGNKLTERFGQPVVVESVTQGVGMVGNQMVSKSAPDGYTLAMLTGGFTTQAAVMKNLLLRPRPRFRLRDQRRRLSDVPAGRANSPIASFKDLLERARAAPGRAPSSVAAASITCSASGSRTAPASSMVAVPYRGSVAAFTDVVGRLDAMLDTATSAIPRIRNGQLRPLAMSSPNATR